MPATFARVDQVKELAAKAGCEVLVGVDGGITKANIGEIANCGADLIVTGSAVFDGRAPADNARFMLEHFARAERDWAR